MCAAKTLQQIEQNKKASATTNKVQEYQVLGSTCLYVSELPELFYPVSLVLFSKSGNDQWDFEIA